MIRKSDLSLRIGMVMLLLCTTLVLTVLPAAATYKGDKNLTEYKNGTITGDMNYTIGDSFYSPKMWSNGSYVYTTTMPENIPNNATTPVNARLYVYWTWSFNDTNTTSSMYDTGVRPSMNVNFAGTDFTTPDASYLDWKDDSEANTTSYNYPSGTYCYNVTGLVSSAANNYVVNITNVYGSSYKQSFNIQAVGLLVWYNQTGTNYTKDYWIDEGNDITYLKANNNTPPIDWKDGIKPSDTKTWANFSGVNTSGMSSATLITAAPSAGTVYNSLFINNNLETAGLWDGSPRDADFSWNTLSIIPGELGNGSNNVTFMNGIDDADSGNDGQMQAANAFLLINK